MKQWLVVILIVFVQETVTLNGLLLKATQGEYSLWVITSLFIIATLIEIVIGFLIARYVKKTLHNGKIKDFATRWSVRFKAYIGKHGRKVYLLLLGYFSFPYLNAFITTWLDIPFWESFWYLVIGNMIFYTTSWLLVLGIATVVPNPVFALVAVVGVTILITIITRLWKSRKI